MLVRLLYASRSDQEIDDALVASILERSQKHNLEHGITGMLCTCSQGNVFLQVLEGSRAAVNTQHGGHRGPRRRIARSVDRPTATESSTTRLTPAASDAVVRGRWRVPAGDGDR